MSSPIRHTSIIRPTPVRPITTPPSPIPTTPSSVTESAHRPSSPYRRAIYDPNNPSPPRTLNTVRMHPPSKGEDQAISDALKTLKLFR